MTSVVTGAFGYIGRHITQLLLDQGVDVRTITTHPDKPNPFEGKVLAFPYDFDQPDRLIQHLQGAETLYNTYWIRFPYREASFESAIANTKTLFKSANRAGIQKIVHISVTNASPRSHLPYYAGKARQEQVLAACGVPYAIIRPTLVYGTGDILVNNIAWLLRRFPVFPIFADGSYRLQPIYVGDLAEIAVKAAREPAGKIQDAIGPETYTFKAFVRLVADHMHSNALLLPTPPDFGVFLGRLISLAVGDILLTSDELRGLMEEMLTSSQEPNGKTRFSNWLEADAEGLGTKYASELDRHFRYPKKP